MIPFLKPTRTKIEYDGTVIDEDIMIFLLANTNSVGGFEKLAPEARLDDGYFDLFIIRKINLAELIHIATLARSEEHTSELQSRGHLVCRLLLEKKKY